MFRKAKTFLMRYGLKSINNIFTNKKQRENLLKLLDNIPESNGSKYYKPLDFTVGIVADSFLYENFIDTCNLKNLTPDNWFSVLPDLDCVIVTSTWHGINNEWTGLSNPNSDICKKLKYLIEKTKETHCPVIFYSKEDPVNFKWFKDYAQNADFIFTSSENSVCEYKKIYPNIPVDIMPFAISPKIHNPIGMSDCFSNNRVFFAGSWMTKYPKRTQSQKDLFDWISELAFDFDIADRNFQRYNIRYQYPFKYLSHVIGDFSYRDIAKLYKLYPWTINLNSITECNTMFARRVYDATVCGTLLLSNESIGMEKLFPEVFVINNFDDLKHAFSISKEEFEIRRLCGIRRTFRLGTVYEKMEIMLNSVGINNTKKNKHKVGVILCSNIENYFDYIKMYNNQTYENKCLIISESQIYMLSDCDIVAFWGCKRIYDKYYLEDMINAFKYTNCDYITKDKFRKQHTYTDEITDIYATIFWKDSLSHISKEIEIEHLNMPNGYIIDDKNYINLSKEK